MGKKEKLIIEYFALRHQFDVNEGENCSRPWNEIPSPWEIRDWMREYKVIDLEEKVAAVKRSLEAQAKKIKVKEYFETKEGSKVKTNLEARREELFTEHKNLENEYGTKLNNMIVNVLGDKFITDFNGSSDRCHMCIGIKNTDKDRKGFTFKFGHEFEMTYEKHWFRDDCDLELKINYGTLGHFNAITDEDRIAYIVGFGKFLENIALKEEVISTFKEFIKKETVISNEANEIYDKLNNPFKD